MQGRLLTVELVVHCIILGAVRKGIRHVAQRSGTSWHVSPWTTSMANDLHCHLSPLAPMNLKLKIRHPPTLRLPYCPSPQSMDHQHPLGDAILHIAFPATLHFLPSTSPVDSTCRTSVRSMNFSSVPSSPQDWSGYRPLSPGIQQCTASRMSPSHLAPVRLTPILHSAAR